MSLTWAYKELYELKAKSESNAREMKNEKREKPRKLLLIIAKHLTALTDSCMLMESVERDKVRERESAYGMKMKSESNEPIKKKPFNVFVVSFFFCFFAHINIISAYMPQN